MSQHPGMPLALRNNPFSQSYFAALRQRAGVGSDMCAYCGTSLVGMTRLSDGSLIWCDRAHQELWIRQKRDESQKQHLIARGFKVEGERVV